MKNVPEKIYLVMGEDREDGEDFNEFGDVTWCADKINDGDIEYVSKAFLPTVEELVKIIMRYNTPYEAGDAIHQRLTEGK